MKPDINTLILYEDSHIIVCHKPAAVAVQTSRIGAQDMVSLLKNHLAGTLGLSRQNGRTAERAREPYLAVIHRLDQPVEGLLVFAKTPEAAKELNRQLTASGFGKYYRAIVMGTPEPPEGILENYMVKDGRSNTSRICTKDTPGAKLARLHYRVIQTYKETRPAASLVEIKLDTGRHHQIRVQMAHLGCPLEGDRKYGSCEGTSQTLKLCAYKLEFRHPQSGKKMNFQLPYEGNDVERRPKTEE